MVPLVMRLKINELHASTSAKELSNEWFVLENQGDRAFNAKGCVVALTEKKGARPRTLGNLDPGFVLQAGEQIRIITGGPPKKGKAGPPEDGATNYYLFLKHRLLTRPGAMLHFRLNQQDLAVGIFDPSADGGVGT